VNPAELDLRPAGGGECRANCPHCGDRRRHLYVNRERRLWHCFRCGRAGRLIETALSAPIMRSLSGPADKGKPRPLPPEALDRAYRAMLARLVLSGHHRAHLIDARDFSSDLVEHGLYRSLPASSDLLREDAGRAAAQAVGQGQASRVPGLALRRGGWTVVGPPGLLVPVRDEAGRICGLQVRLDNPKAGGSRYLWLSSRRQGGAGAAARLHWACPAGSGLDGTLWITEGPLKADYAAWRLGVSVIAVPGVTTCMHQVLQAVAERPRRYVVVAFDADLQTNPQVRACALGLVGELELRGLDVSVADWPLDSGKGLDDLLRSGGRPAVLAPFAWRVRLKEDCAMLKIVGWAKVAAPPESQTVARDGRDPMPVFRAILEVAPAPGARGKAPRLPAVAFYQRAEKCAGTGLQEGDTVFVSGSLTTVRQRDASGSGWTEVPGVMLEELAHVRVPDVGGEDGDDGMPF